MFSKRRELAPKSLVTLIVGITVVPLTILLWLGWRLLEQDRFLEAQQAQQHLERAADLVVAALQRALASSEQQLAAGSRQWPDGAVAVTFHEDQIEAYPKGRVAYFPAVSPLREAPHGTFTEGEELEFRKNDRAAATKIYRELAKSSDRATRAGALLRSGRNLAGTGRTEEALAVYGQLAGIDHVAINKVPAGLIGRYARCELLERAQRSTQLGIEARQLASDLNSGRWSLTEPLYRLYAGDAARWTGGEPFGSGEAERFAEAVAALWERRRSLPPSGRESLAIGSRNLGVIWQAAGGWVRGLIVAPEFVESQWLTEAASVAKEQRISFRLGDTGDMGAGDYVTKPFSPRELRARVRALLRRAAPESEPVYRFGDCEVDFPRAELRRCGQRTDLTAIELKMMELFVRNAGRVVTRNHVIDAVWGHDVFVTDRVVDTHVVKLRRKIECDPANPRHIVSVRGIGYRFEA